MKSIKSLLIQQRGNIGCLGIACLVAAKEDQYWVQNTGIILLLIWFGIQFIKPEILSPK